MSQIEAYAALVFSHPKGERMVTNFAATTVIVEGEDQAELGPVGTGSAKTFLFSEQLRAAVGVLQTIKAGNEEAGAEAKIHLYLDSDYLYKGITSWIHRWRNSDWIAATSGKPVQNRELWEKFEALVRELAVTVNPIGDLKFSQASSTQRLHTLVEAARIKLRDPNAHTQVSTFNGSDEPEVAPEPATPAAAPALLPGQGIW